MRYRFALGHHVPAQKAGIPLPYTGLFLSMMNS